jgi:acetyl esterase/lipase
MLAYRSTDKDLNIPIKGMILRQAAFIYGQLDSVAKPEWKSRLTSREENFDAPILGGRDVMNILALPISDLTNPHDFPIFASPNELKERMPPTYIVLASCDPMANEVALFHKLLDESGVET